MKYLKLFEDFEPQKSKRQLKSELWHKRNPDPKGKIFTPEQVEELGVSKGIVDMMREWPIIYKSPYSKSFYSSDDISWSKKPDDSFRTSDHWNFLTPRTGNKIHCPTDIPVKSVTHYSIGKWNKSEGIYKILKTEPSQQFEIEQLDKAQRKEYLTSPEVIQKKREFKKLITDNQLKAEINFKGIDYSGWLDKYSGNDVRLKDDSGNVIFTTNVFNSYPNQIKIFDRSGNEITNPL